VSTNLNERLGRLARGPRTPAPPPEVGTIRNSRRRKAPPGLETVLPGEEIRTARGVCWLHERPLERWPGIEDGLAGRLAQVLASPAPDDLERDCGWAGWRSRGVDSGLFLDLETTGLAATPVFLCGLLSCSGGEMTFRLLLARDYSEEAALLEAISGEITRRPVVVSFNGKSYDIPFLKERTGRLRTASCRPDAHFDLLHPARRRWSDRLPDCRLKTLEWAILGRRRGGDIDGAEIPAIYHRFVRDRDPRPLLRVMAHNLHDLYTLAELTMRTAQTRVAPLGTPGEKPNI